MKKLFGFAAVLVVLSLVADARAAVVALEFADGNGTTSVDRYTGQANTGAGWATNWSLPNAGGGSTSASVTAATPLHGGGNYLNVSINQTRGAVARQYVSQTTPPALDTTLPHIVQWNYRPDAVGTGFLGGGSAAMFFDSTVTNQTTSSANSWHVNASMQTGTWRAANGNKSGGTISTVDLGLPFVVGELYTIAVRVNPAVKEYDVFISNGTDSVLATDFGWRTSATTVGRYLHFGMNSSGATGGVNGVDSTVTFSLDAISLSNGTKTLAGAGVSNWFNTFHWASQGAPSAFDIVTVDNGGTVNINSPQNRKAYAGSVNLDNGTLGVTTELEVLGTLALNSGGVLHFDSSSLSDDSALIRVGDLNLNGGTIDITGLAGNYRLIEYDGAVTGSLDSITLMLNGVEIISNNVFLLHDLGTQSINLVFIPEPGTFLLAAVGGMAGLGMRRQRGRRAARKG